MFNNPQYASGAQRSFDLGQQRRNGLIGLHLLLHQVVAMNAKFPYRRQRRPGNC